MSGFISVNIAQPLSLWRCFLKMKNLNLYIIAIFTIFITVFLTLIIYVSLLGDNHKINYAVEQYFADIKNRTFTTPCRMKMPSNTEEAMNNCRDNCFLLETALLENFGLLKAKDYTVEIERGHFWIPFITDDTVSVGIAFTRKQESFFKDLIDKKEIAYIDNLITIKKENKLWRIQNKNLKP